MITTLLWRCPVCGTDDALKARKRWFWPGLLSCSNCGTQWQINRVIGEDYRLVVVAGNDELRGTELSLTEWYDRMKAGLTLVPRNDSRVALDPGEHLYLCCAQSELIVSAQNPLRNHWPLREAPHAPSPDELSAKWGPVGKGTLYMTSERLIWESPQLAVDFPWRRVQSAFTFHVLYFGIMFGATAYRFSTPGQSILKWLTYTGKIANDILLPQGHKMSLSSY